MGPLEKVGLIITVVAAMYAFLPNSNPLQTLPGESKYVPFFAVLIFVVSLTVYHSRKNKSPTTFREKWFLFTRARGNPDVVAFHSSRSARYKALKSFVNEVLSRKEREQSIKSHRNKLMTEFIEFSYTKFGRGKVFRKPIELSWRQYIELFAFSKIFLQHLCTGHKEIYALLDNNQLRFENGLEHLIRGFSLDTDSLGGVCHECLKLYDEMDIPSLRESLSTCV